MKYSKETRNALNNLLLLVCVAIIGLTAFMVALDVSPALAFPLIALVILLGVARWKKIIADEQAALEFAKNLKQKQEAEATAQNSSSGLFFGQTTDTASAPKTQATFVSTLKRIARENASKEQRQKFASYSHLKEVCEKLNAYAFSRGIKLGENAAESLVMAMLSSKCIFVRKTGENTEDILSVIGEFFSGERSDCFALENAPLHAAGLLYYYQDNVLMATEFFQKLYAYSFAGNTVCTCALKDFSELSFENVFSELITLFKKPYATNFCTMVSVTATDIPKIADKKFPLPNNVWFFFLLNGGEKLPKDASLWSETIELSGVGSKTDSKPSHLPMAHSQLSELLDDTFEESFLPLDTWKKLDKVEEYLHGAVGFKIDNLLARKIERITTMQVACGSTPAQAMDIAISRDILPLLADYGKDALQQEGTTLKELLDGLFGGENLPESHKVLSELQLD